MNKKTISLLVLGLLLGSGSIGAYQVAAQTDNAVQTPTIAQQQETQEFSKDSTTVQDDNEKEGIESENKKGGDIEKDGIDHQFEGEEEHTD